VVQYSRKFKSGDLIKFKGRTYKVTTRKGIEEYRLLELPGKAIEYIHPTLVDPFAVKAKNE
jgi:hypothetical protein